MEWCDDKDCRHDKTTCRNFINRMKTPDPIEWCRREGCTHDNADCLNFYCNQTIAFKWVRESRGYGREEIWKEVRCLPRGCLGRYRYYKDTHEGDQCKQCYERQPLRPNDPKQINEI